MATTMKALLERFRIIATYIKSPHVPHDTLPQAVAKLDLIWALATTTVEELEAEIKP